MRRCEILMMLEREAWKYEEDKFKRKLANALENVKRSYRFGRFGYEIINKVSTTWKIQGRRPDITVFVLNQPFLIIECKIKPYSSISNYTINQAYTYALLAKNEGYSVDFVATTDLNYMRIFRVPENIEDYANWEAIERKQYNKAFRPELYWRARYGDLFIKGFSYSLDTPEAPKVLYEVVKKLIEENVLPNLRENQKDLIERKVRIGDVYWSEKEISEFINILTEFLFTTGKRRAELRERAISMVKNKGLSSIVDLKFHIGKSKLRIEGEGGRKIRIGEKDWSEKEIAEFIASTIRFWLASKKKEGEFYYRRAVSILKSKERIVSRSIQHEDIRIPKSKDRKFRYFRKYEELIKEWMKTRRNQ